MSCASWPDERLDPGAELVVVHPLVALGGDGGDHGEDPADEVGPAGGGVLLGGAVERVDDEVDRLVAAQPLAEPELHDGAGVQDAAAGLDVVLLLVATAGDVVLEQPALAAPHVVAGEQRHDAEPLHGGRQVVAHHLPELVGLALEAEDGALHLLVVLELELEQLHHLDGRAGRAGDGDAAEAVGREHLLHLLVADPVARVARRSPAITTPSANRTPSTVVPCVIASACGDLRQRVGSAASAAAARRTRAPDHPKQRTSATSYAPEASEAGSSPGEQAPGTHLPAGRRPLAATGPESPSTSPSRGCSSMPVAPPRMLAQSCGRDRVCRDASRSGTASRLCRISTHRRTAAILRRA